MENIFKGTINGKEYTDYDEFTTDLAKISNKDGYCITTTFTSCDESESCDKLCGCEEEKGYPVVCDTENELESGFDAEKYIPNLDTIMDAAEEGEDLDSLYADFDEKIEEIRELDSNRTREVLFKIDKFVPVLENYTKSNEGLLEERRLKMSYIDKELAAAKNRVDELERDYALANANYSRTSNACHALKRVNDYVYSIVMNNEIHKRSDGDFGAKKQKPYTLDEVIAEYARRFFPTDVTHGLDKRHKEIDDEEKKRNGKLVGHYPFPSQKWKNDFRKFVLDMFNF